MRTAILLVFVGLCASSALAQDSFTPSSKPDYSKDTLLRLMADQKPPEHEPRIQFHIGSVAFKALGTEWNFVYLPIMMPLSGTRFGVTREWPDPFTLTGTPIATPPRLWRPDRRAINRELKRIERTTAKVKVNLKAE